MNYFEIKVNPNIYGVEETIKKNDKELLLKSLGVFDISHLYQSENKGNIFTLDKEGVSYEYKASFNNLSYHVNTNLEIHNVNSSILSSYPVSSIQPTKYEDEEIQKIILEKEDSFEISEDYNFVTRTFIFKSNDTSLISTHNVHEVDYFHKILGVISELQRGEYCRYQITLTPASDFFKESIKKIDFDMSNMRKRQTFSLFVKDNKSMSISQRSVFDNLAKEKMNSIGYFATLRVFFFSKNTPQKVLEEKAKNIQMLIEKLCIYDSFIENINEGDDYFYNYYNSINASKSFKKGSILVRNELLSVFHFPIFGNIKIPNLKLQLFQKLPIPPELVCDPNQMDVMIGKNDFGGKERPFYMDDNLRFRHTYTIGTSGSGKSTLMENMALQDIYNGRGIFLLDPHGDLVDNIMQKFPDPRNPLYKDRYKDLVYIDFGDKTRSVGINILEASDQYEESKVINAFTDLLQKVFPNQEESMGPTFFQYIINTIKTIRLFTEFYKPTLGDIVRVLTRPDYRNMCMQQVPKNKQAEYMDLFDFWETHDKRTGAGSQSQNKDEIVPHISTKLTKFTENPYISNIVSQPVSTINFFDLMNSNKIILVKMSKGAIGEDNMRFLGLIIISKLLIDIFKRESIREDERVPFFIYVDEFQNFVTKEFEQLLSEARKYKISLNIAHQYIDQLVNQKTKDESVQKAVFGNAGTFISFRVGPNDIQKLEERYGNRNLLPKESFINIDKHNAYISTQGGSGTKNALTPFHVSTTISDKPQILKRSEKGEIIQPKQIDHDTIQKIIEISKNTYCGKPETIQEIRKTFKIWFP